MTTLSVRSPPTLSIRLVAALLAWGAAVALASEAGVFAAAVRASAPAYGVLIALGIAIPSALYLTWTPLRRTLDAVPLRALTLFHVPRIAGGVLFLAYGLSGQLNPLFALLVGVGDIVSGLAATAALRGEPSPSALARIHRIGLADFAIGLTCGMVLGLVGDPRMAPIADLPLAQVVLWYVGMLATTHVVVLARLARAGRSA